MVVTAGVTVKVLVPLKSFQPVQPPDAQQESAVPVTVQVMVEELPGAAVVRGEAEIVRVGAVTALTTTFISSVVVSPRLSVTVRRKVYVPAMVILLKVGVRVVLLVMEAITGPPALVQTVEATDPPGSVAEAPLIVMEEVGRVILRSVPAFEVGAVLAVTVTVALFIPLDTPAFQHSSV